MDISVCFLRQRLLYVYCCLLMVAGGAAQYRIVSVPEIRKQIAAAGADTTKARLYNMLAWELRFTDSAEAVLLTDQAIRIAEKNADHLRLAEAYRTRGFVYVLAQQLQASMDMYAIAIDHARKAKDGYNLAYTTGLIGGMYNDKGDFDQSIRYYLEGIRLAEQYHCDEMIAFLSNCVGEAYSDAGRPVSFTLPFYQRALKIEKNMANWQYMGMICSNIAKEQMLAGNRAAAEKAAADAIDYINRKPERLYVYATVATDIGEVYTGLGDYDKAEQYLKQGFQILDSIKTRDNVLIPLSALAKLYLKKNQPDKAEASARQLLQLATEYRSKPFLRDAYKVLTETARKKQQYTAALAYYDQYNRWNDSLYNENRQKSIADVESRIRLRERELEAKYEAGRKTEENRSLRELNLSLRNKNIIAVITAGILLLTGILLVAAYRITQRRNRQLEAQKQIIEQQSREKDTLLREINHRVKNNLQVISSLLNLQANSLTDEKAVEALRDSYKRVKAISLIHQKLYGTDEIGSIPMGDYIKTLYTDLMLVYNAQHIRLDCTTYPLDLELDIESAVPLGLILNETITNALKYAFTGRAQGIIQVRLIKEAGNSCLLEVEDDGVGLPEGFDPEQSASLGFRIIRELSRQLRGEFSYSNRGGACFQIRFKIIALLNSRN
jgi:two-component sensor histidine kinase